MRAIDCNSSKTKYTRANGRALNPKQAQERLSGVSRDTHVTVHLVECAVVEEHVVDHQDALGFHWMALAVVEMAEIFGVDVADFASWEHFFSLGANGL